MKNFQNEVELELKSAKSKFKPFNSAHEGYAVILEEIDELWDEVKKKPTERNIQNIYNELIQISAMAQRFSEDLVTTNLIRIT